MVVLIVDDQTNVVSGIISGINWEKIHISRVLKAYNAHEAKTILESQVVDIILCDIEMPAESGLSLFRWVKMKELNVECIFLTAHADFMYAKEAVQLGGFDYILQPARYEDIEQAIVRLEEKIINKKKQEEYSSYGLVLFNKKNKLLDSMLNDWYFEKDIELSSVLEDFKRLHIYIEEKSKIFLVLLHIMSWYPDAKRLKTESLKSSLEHKAAELFGYYGQKVLLSELEHENFTIMIYTDCNVMIDVQGLLRQLELLIEFCKNTFQCSASCYAGWDIYPVEIPNRIKQLLRMKKNNVMLSSKVFLFESSSKDKYEKVDFYNMKHWVNLLVDGGTKTVREECCFYLEKLTTDGQLNAESLKRFYQSFLQILFKGAEQLNISIDTMFDDNEALEKSLNSYATINDMYEFINFAMDYFEGLFTTGKDTKTLIDQIIQYIHNNVERDIKRNDIAEVVFLNPDYMSKLFKRKTGMSLKEFIMFTKMKEARTLLKTTKLPISIIAAKVGYVHFSHFSQVYKKILGVTPGEDREN
jgi:two-component system, response regulator YesN